MINVNKYLCYVGCVLMKIYKSSLYQDDDIKIYIFRIVSVNYSIKLKHSILLTTVLRNNFSLWTEFYNLDWLLSLEITIY